MVRIGAKDTAGYGIRLMMSAKNSTPLDVLEFEERVRDNIWKDAIAKGEAIGEAKAGMLYANFFLTQYSKKPSCRGIIGKTTWGYNGGHGSKSTNFYR